MKTFKGPWTALTAAALAFAASIAHAADGPHRGAENEGVVHFLAETGSSLERFDLDTGARLSDLAFPMPVDSFTVDAERIYYAGDRLVSSMSLEGGDHEPLANTIGSVLSLAVLGDDLYARVEASPELVSLDKRTGAINEMRDHWYSPREMHASTLRSSLFGYGGYGLQRISVNAGGTFGETVESPHDEDYRVGERV